MTYLYVCSDTSEPEETILSHSLCEEVGCAEIVTTFSIWGFSVEYTCMRSCEEHTLLRVQSKHSTITKVKVTCL